MDVVGEWVLLSRPKSAIRLTKGNEEVHVFFEVNEVLRISGPHSVVIIGVLERGSAGVLLSPSTLESEASPFVWEINADEEIVITLTNNRSNNRNERMFTTSRQKA